MDRAQAFGGEWQQAGGRTPLVFDIADEEGFDIDVSTTCKEGAYRIGYEAVGRGPALPGNPSGNPFKHQDYGWTTRIFSAGDCAG